MNHNLGNRLKISLCGDRQTGEYRDSEDPENTFRAAVNTVKPPTGFFKDLQRFSFQRNRLFAL